SARAQPQSTCSDGYRRSRDRTAARSPTDGARPRPPRPPRPATPGTTPPAAAGTAGPRPASGPTDLPEACRAAPTHPPPQLHVLPVASVIYGAALHSSSLDRISPMSRTRHTCEHRATLRTSCSSSSARSARSGHSAATGTAGSIEPRELTFAVKATRESSQCRSDIGLECGRCHEVFDVDWDEKYFTEP